MPKYKVAVAKSIYLTFYATADSAEEAEDMVSDYLHDAQQENDIVEPDPQNTMADWELTFELPTTEDNQGDD